MAIYPATKHESIQWQEGGFEPGTSGCPAPSTGYVAYTSLRKQPPFFAPRLICSRPSVVGDERKKKNSEREKGERIVPWLSLPLFFLSLALFFPLDPSYRKPGTGYYTPYTLAGIKWATFDVSII